MSTTEPSVDEQETPLDPDEPHTPIWLTFLGMGLFLFGAIFLLATSGDPAEAPAVTSVEAGEPAPDSGAEGRAPPAEAAADPHAGHGHN
jgi:hypothetical protein